MKHSQHPYVVSCEELGIISRHRTLQGARRSLERDQRAIDKRLGAACRLALRIVRADGEPFNEEERKRMKTDKNG